jgi:hypothetical protein
VNVARLLGDIRSVGGSVTLIGNDLKLRIPKSAPRDLIDAVRAAKPELITLLRENPDADDDLEERAALVEYGAGVPREWAEGFARLDCSKPPQGYPLPRWHQIINDGGLFLDQWAHQAAELGWTALDVFGVNPAAPLVRYDGMGLVPLIQGCRVISIAADSAQIKTSSGNTQTYSRRPRLDAVALWQLRDKN